MSILQRSGGKLQSSKSTTQQTWACLNLLYNIAPGLTVGTLLISLFVSLVPVVFLIVQRDLVNRVVEAISPPDKTTVWTVAVIALAVVFALLSILGEIGESIQMYVSQLLRDSVALSTNQRLLDKVATFATLDLHEDPRLLNRFRLAQEGANSFGQLTWTLFATISGFLTVVPVLLLVGTIAWWIPFAMLLALAPSIVLTMRIGPREWAAREELAEQERLRDLLHDVGTSSAFSRDLRLYSASPLIVRKWSSVAHPILRRVNEVRARIMRGTLWLSLVSGLAVVLPLLWVIQGTERGDYQLGDLVMLIGAIIALRTGLWQVFGNTGELVGQVTGGQKYLDFMGVLPPAAAFSSNSMALPPLQQELIFDDVSFTYPGAESPAIQNLRLKICAGTSIALVGANGAGKSTISALIGRLFDPTEGALLWDDIDLGTVAPDVLRQRLAFVTQDFARFPISLRENIAIGRSSDLPADREIVQALQDVGLGFLVKEHGPAILDRPLTKELSEGIQLSGGQWQRLAIARAMIRVGQVDLVVFDEPTAALDPIQEREIVQHMLELAHGKTALVISHRLGICTLVDRVIVLDHGRIVEEGSHRELLAANGAYAAMFRAQASWYRDD